MLLRVGEARGEGEAGYTASGGGPRGGQKRFKVKGVCRHPTGGSTLKVFGEGCNRKRKQNDFDEPRGTLHGIARLLVLVADLSSFLEAKQSAEKKSKAHY